MSPSVSAVSASQRRVRAGELFAAGFSQADVARRLGVTRQSALRWHRLYEQGGVEALAPRQRGRPTKLTPEQLDQLGAALQRGPAAHGWTTDLWTLERIAKLVQRLFGVRFHRGHVWKLMGSMGWSLQRPTTRARERDEEAIARWKREDWPRLKKTRGARRPSSSSTKAASPRAR